MKIETNKYSTSFQGGLTKKMQQDIASCNIREISKELSKMGISNNFKNNKVIAWCSLKCIDIFQKLNLQFDLNLPFPNGIFVEDFKKFNITQTEASGFCNIAPTILNKKTKIIVPEKTLFFNEYPEGNYKNGNIFWDNIDEISDSFYKKFSGTSFFLDLFLHEFSHVIHEEHLLKIFSGKKLYELIYETIISQNTKKFKDKYLKLLSENCCFYSAYNPLEAVACDMSKRICDSLDKNNLIPKTNFIKNSPYRDFTFKERFFEFFKEDKYNKTIRRFWNGNFK